MSDDSRWKVLVVDDEADIRFLLKRILEDAGYEVVEAPNGAVALARMVKSRPDLVVTDMMMPVMGGAELIARLRSDPETESIPVVVVTAQHGISSSVADAVVTKPFELGELLETVHVLARAGG